MFRLIWIILLQLLILWIFGQPEHTSIWSALYNGITILGRIVMFLFDKPIVWFPDVITTKYIIVFVLGCFITAAASLKDDDEEKGKEIYMADRGFPSAFL